jgi:hypothetical protein
VVQTMIKAVRGKLRKIKDKRPFSIPWIHNLFTFYHCIFDKKP